MSIPTPHNFKEFKSYVGKYGFSLSNFYDVVFNLNNPTLQNVLSRNLTNNLITGDSPDSVKNLMRAYAEECTIPGYQISTGEYRINNSPQLKYAYGIVNNEITMSFICDADSEIRKSFDSWVNYIYAQVSPNVATTLNLSGIAQLGRTRYRDDYSIDIVVIKYERFASSKKNRFAKIDTGLQANVTSFHLTSDIIPGYNGQSVEGLTSGFGKAIPVYSVRLLKAFPTNVSSLSLSSGSSQLLKLQVTFEYETAVSSAMVSGSTLDGGTWQTVVP